MNGKPEHITSSVFKTRYPASDRSVSQVFRYPVDMPVHDVEHELRLLRPMWLAGIHNHLRGNPFALERVIHLVALRGRNADIRLAVQNQRRGLRVSNEGEGGHAHIAFRLVVPGAFEI